MVGQLTQTLINISRSIPKEEAATKIAKCWRGYQARTELSSVKNTLATITRESQENNRRITFNDIHHSYKQILGLNEAEELVAKQHKTLHPEDAAAVTNKLETCVTADKPVEEAFKNVIFKNIHSYEEFLKTLPADKRAASATQRIGKLPFEEELPDFKDKLAEFVANPSLITKSPLKTGSKDIKFAHIGFGQFGNVYSFEVGDKKYVLKVFGNAEYDCINDKRRVGLNGVDQLHGYLAETNRLFYLQAKHPDLAKHFAQLHYADLGSKNKFAISEYVEKAKADYDNLNSNNEKLKEFGFKYIDTLSSNAHGAKIIDAGGIHIINPSYPSAKRFTDEPIHIDKSESKDKIHVSDYEPARYSNNTPLVVSVPHSKSSRVSKLADPQHPLHQQYLRYAGQAYTKPAHISVFVPSSDSASK